MPIGCVIVIGYLCLKSPPASVMVEHGAIPAVTATFDGYTVTIDLLSPFTGSDASRPWSTGQSVCGPTSCLEYLKSGGGRPYVVGYLLAPLSGATVGRDVRGARLRAEDAASACRAEHALAVVTPTGEIAPLSEAKFGMTVPEDSADRRPYPCPVDTSR